MRIKVIYLALMILTSDCSHGAIETISGFQFQTCRGATCYKVKANRALKGYLSRIFVLEGPIEIVQTSADGSRRTWSGNDALYDPVRMSFLIHGKKKDILFEVSNVQLVEFDRG